MPKSPLRSRWLVWAAMLVVMLSWIARRPGGERRDGAANSLVARSNSAFLPAPPPREVASQAFPLVRAAASRLPALFEFMRPVDAARLDAALPAPAREIHYVRVDASLAAGKRSPFWQKPGAGRFEVPLPEGGAVVVIIEDSEMLGPDRFVSWGRIEGEAGSRALFAWNGGFLNASIESVARGNLALRTANADLAQFYRVDPALVPPCGGQRDPRNEPAGPRRSASVISDGRAPVTAPEPAGGVENPQHAEVHVLMIYTERVLNTLAGAPRAAALQSAFDLAIARVNRVFEASLITARVKLVGMAETSYDEEISASSRVQDDALTALYKTDDGKMDEIHALRDATGADIVCLSLGRPDSVSSGLSFLLNEPGKNGNGEYAFSVVNYLSIAGTNVVPHELGHVLGCAHDRANALNASGAYLYSYGYRFVGADRQQYHDIMSYPPGIELGYFSNPRISLPAPINAPIGIAAGLPGESDIALTIEQNAFTTASFRLQTQNAAGPGSLVNVATRGFVGTGDQALMGGFVVTGSQPQEILIRAAGPALAAFGVTNALADPVLQLFAGAALAAQNDNWSLPLDVGRAAAAGEIANAAAQVRAFPFAAGSADAAVLVTLAPGAYTAVVEGVRGTTGTGLIEAYAVGASTGRIIALATRGYADRTGMELYAGFVVQGEGRATKRVLIRALGPTLSRSPFNLPAVLDDPEMELRNAAGELLIVNDDWSTGADGGASVANDFKPLVKSHGEREIFATGHAPSNRREPCLLVDLPPGNYSVVVRPFELRDPDPLRDQPAQPGLAVVEVYEVGR